MPVGEKTREACERFPSISTRALADYLVKKYPKTFNFEQARSLVRRHRGKLDSGYKRLKIKNPIPMTIPKSHAKPYEPFNVTGMHRTLVLSDVHLPYHDETALTAAMDYAKKYKPTVILINGDLLDCHTVSDFEKDAELRSLGEELETGREFLTSLRAAYKKARIIFRTGNHEDRLKRYIAKKAPELLGVNEIRLENLLRLDSMGIEFVTDKRVINVGKLPVLHGHEFYQGMNSPVNAARGLFMKGKASAVQGHLHQTSEHTETNLSGHTITTWSVGCLSGLNPSYSPLASLKWNHGMMTIETDRRGMFEVSNLRLINGRFV
jgi:predicted phosphodiesterase